MSLRDFLERFRPAGTPGASATGVPADRMAERAAELAPALARLTDVQQQAAGIRAAAEETAEALRQNAVREAEQVLSDAREQAPEVRRQAAEPLLRAARQETDALRAAGDGTASAIRERARERMPHLVDLAVADAMRLASGTVKEP
jgi:cell division septum initiation protein DivIVA